MLSKNKQTQNCFREWGEKGKLPNLFFEILKPDKKNTSKENYNNLTFHVDSKS